MKIFIYAGLALGAVITLIGICLFADKIDYVTGGIETPATVTGFKVARENVKEFGRVSMRPVYYPVMEYSFQGHHYDYVHNVRQMDINKPFYSGKTLTFLCTVKQPGKPFAGTQFQLIMSNMFVGLSGVAVMLVCGVMGIVFWMKGDFEDRPVSFENQVCY